MHYDRIVIFIDSILLVTWGWNNSTPLLDCLCPVLSSGPAWPFCILHKARQRCSPGNIIWNSCSHIYDLMLCSPWGPALVTHCSFCSILTSILLIESKKLESWNSTISMIVIIFTFSRFKRYASSIHQKSSAPPSDNPSERCFCGRASHFIFIQQWLHQ